MFEMEFKFNTQLFKGAERRRDVINATRRNNLWLDNLPLCIKVVDLDFNLQYMSKVGINTLGIADISAYYGKPYPLEFYPPLFRDLTTKNIKCARDTGQTVIQEAAILTIHGDKVWYHSTIVPIYDEDNQLEYFLIASMDITERKSAELKNHKMNSELESLVASRTKELEETNRQLKIHSETDFLTKLSNRRFYERRLSENITIAKHNQTYLSLLIVDIDNFKEYNDTYGHNSGDITLFKVAKSIKNSLHKVTDLVSRFGGEEFVVLLPETDAESAFTIAENIRMNVKKLGIKHSQSGTGMVNVSIGVETLKGNKLNKNDLFKNSDAALYTAKNSGRNCSRRYTD
jgi:diguanylate cyclase (GGDEF)-like protein/PAS domain S-box-containing protein